MNKLCTQCGVTRDISEFHARNERHSKARIGAHCKQCHAKRMRRNRLLRQAAIDAPKSKPCADCGVQYPPWIMQFDHRPGETKSHNISALRRGSARLILAAAEAAKCDVVCANCHADRTYRRTMGMEADG